MDRKSDADRLAGLKARQEQLKQQIIRLEQQAREKERRDDTRRKIIVGAAVMEHARLHPEFAATLKAVLAIAITREIDQKAIEDWLNGLFVPSGGFKEYATDDPASAE